MLFELKCWIGPSEHVLMSYKNNRVWFSGGNRYTDGMRSFSELNEDLIFDHAIFGYEKCMIQAADILYGNRSLITKHALLNGATQLAVKDIGGLDHTFFVPKDRVIEDKVL